MKKKPNLLLTLIKAMRIRHWTKNAAIFAALIFDRQLLNLFGLQRTIAGFFIFCLISSVVYIFNDIADVESDRKHPVKKHRPIASGDLPVGIAIGFALVLVIVIFPFAYMLSPSFAGIVASILCSIWHTRNG